MMAKEVIKVKSPLNIASTGLDNKRNVAAYASSVY